MLIIKQFIKRTEGVLAVEGAFLFMAAITLTFGIIEVGHYFNNSQIQSSNVGLMAQRVNADYQDPGNASDIQLMSDEDSYICVVSAPTYAAAKALDCAAPSYNVTIPDGETEAYAKIVGRVTQQTLSGIEFFENLFPDSSTYRVVRVGTMDDCPTDDRTMEEFGMCEIVTGDRIAEGVYTPLSGEYHSGAVGHITGIRMNITNRQQADPVCTPTGWKCECDAGYNHANLTTPDVNVVTGVWRVIEADRGRPEQTVCVPTLTPGPNPYGDLYEATNGTETNICASFRRRGIIAGYTDHGSAFASLLSDAPVTCD